MASLFEKTEIKGLNIANRFVRSATWEGRATAQGACTPKLIEHMSELANGEVGLIISGQAYVRSDGKAVPWQLGLDKDELVHELQMMTNAVHESGGKIVAQISHAGIFADSTLTKRAPLAVTRLKELADKSIQEIGEKEIIELLDAFGQAAARVKEAEFDGVQIHAAHGYLLSQFLSPSFNQRTDGYGGTVQNRARAVVQVIGSVRQSVGSDFPVIIKMNSADFVEGGLTIEESLEMAVLFAENGVDAIELSGGTLISGTHIPWCTGMIFTKEKEAYFKEAARKFHARLQVPLILVGGIRSIQVAEQLVEDNVADYIAMSRPLIREPNLIKEWKGGYRGRAACDSDNGCFRAGMAGKGVYCVVLESLRKKETISFSD